MSQTQDIIESLNLTFSYKSEHIASRCNSIIESIFYSKIIPELELSIPTKIPQDINIELDVVEIDIGKIHERDLEGALALRIRQQFELEILSKFSVKNGTFFSDKLIASGGSYYILFNALETFLVKGYLPNWIDKSTSLNEVVLTLIDKQGEDLILFLKNHLANETAIKRLVFNIEAKTYDKIVQSLKAVNYQWIIRFKNNLITINRNSSNNKFKEKSSIEMIHFIMLSHLLKDSSSSFNRNEFIQSVLSSYLVIFDIQPKAIEGSINLINENPEEIKSLLSTLQKLKNNQTLRPDSKKGLENGFQDFISSLNSINTDLSSNSKTYSNKKIVGFIKDANTRNRLVNQLNNVGILRVLKRFYSEDAEALISFISSFKNVFDKLYSTYLEANTSLNNLVLITIIYLNTKGNGRLDFENYFLFLISLNGNKSDLTKNISAYSDFIESQSRLDKKILLNRILDKKVTKELEKRKNLVSNVLNISKDYSEKSLFESKKSKSNIGIYKKEIIEYYLHFGYLPKRFSDLTLNDVQLLFEELINIKSPIIANLIRQKPSLKQLSKRLEILLTKDNAEVLGEYLFYYFKDSYQEILKSFSEAKREINFQTFSKENALLFDIKIVLKTLIFSNDEFNTSSFLFYINKFLLEEFPTANHSSKHNTKGALSITSKRTIDKKEAESNSDILLKKVIENDYNKFIQLLHHYNFQTQTSENLNALRSRIRFYLKMYPDDLSNAVKQHKVNFQRDMVLLKLHLQKDVWELFKSIVLKDFEGKNIQIIKESEVVLDQMKDSSSNLTLEIADLKNVSPSKRRVILLKVLSDTSYFNVYYLQAGPNKIPSELECSPTFIQKYLNTLFGFVPKSSTQSYSKDFWKKLIFRFAIHLRLEDRNLDDHYFAAAFIDQLKNQLGDVYLKHFYFETIKEMEESKDELLIQLSILFNKNLDLDALNGKRAQKDTEAVQDDSLLNNELLLRIRHAISTLVFYAQSGFFPWWSEQNSLAELIDSIHTKSRDYGNLFETVFLQMDSEDRIMDLLVTELPDEIIAPLSSSITSHSSLRIKWDQSVSKLKIKNTKQSSKVKDLQSVSFKTSKINVIDLITHDYKNSELLTKSLYFLKDKDILKALTKEKSISDEQINLYLKLAPHFNLQTIITPIKWRHIVYSFVFQFYDTDSITSNAVFHRSFVAYLVKEHNHIPWKDVFTALNAKLQEPSVFPKVPFPKSLDSLISKDVQEQESHLISDIIDLKKLDSNKRRTVLLKILSDNMYFNAYYSQLKTNKIPSELECSATFIQKYLNALFGFVPKSLTQTYSKDFWKKLIFRFSIHLKLVDKNLDGHYFATAFIDHMKNQLGDVYLKRFHFETIMEMKDSKDELLNHLSVLFNKTGDFDALNANIVQKDDDSLQTNELELSIRHTISTLIFYAQSGFFPWWSEHTSIAELIDNIHTKSRNYGNLFETVFLKMDSEDSILDILATRLPDEIVAPFSTSIASHTSLKSKWDQSLSNVNIKNTASGPKLKDLKNLTFNTSKIDIIELFNTHYKNSEILTKSLYFLKDEDILKAFVKEKSLSNEQISVYLKLAPHISLKTIITPIKWRQIVYSFVFKFYAADSAKSNEVFHKSFVAYLVKQNYQIPWKDVFTTLNARLQEPSVMPKVTFPKSLYVLIPKDSVLQDPGRNIPQLHTNHNQDAYKINVIDLISSDYKNPKLLIKYLYFLKDEDILRVFVKEKSLQNEQISIYLKLAPHFNLQTITPIKWRQIVYSFVFKFYDSVAIKSDEVFHRSFVSYLLKEHSQIAWKDIFYALHSKLQEPGAFPKLRFPNSLYSIISEDRVGQDPNLNIAKAQANQNDAYLVEDNIEIKISNAGLVLIWPFLTRLFEKLDLMKNNKFLGDEERNRAIHLLQYIAFNSYDYPEYELVLNKLLVGMPMQEHLISNIDLSKEEMDIAISLLNGFKNNWGKVKNSSIEAIQETFIRRDGLLYINDEKATLKIEKKGVDVLLDSISWNITLVKLPWMQYPLYIEWK